MDARPWLVEVGRRLREAGLEAVLIGNAAAALPGAPVTRSKKAARRPRDLAVLEILERALEEAERQKQEARGPRARE